MRLPVEPRVIENDPPSNVKAGVRVVVALIGLLFGFAWAVNAFFTPRHEVGITAAAPARDAATDGPQIGEWR